MKKFYVMMAAVSAMMLTACSSDNDIALDNNGLKTEAAQQGVGFDVYVGKANQQTRSGRSNVMTTTTMQKTGFGVFGYQHNGTPGKYSYSSAVPDFMWNQQVSYTSSPSAAWYYAPLKYWPNETANDSQEAGMPKEPTGTNIDKLSFMAYAPWIEAVGSTGLAVDRSGGDDAGVETGETVGITQITKNDGKLGSSVSDPKVRYVVATNPDQSVDLLWGVAPVGGLSYQNVSGSQTTVTEGMPLKDLLKPAVNTNIKFLFQHALARLGVKIVAAADQVSAGGHFDIGNSKITVEEIQIKGNFGTAGVLNLNNEHANVAKWEGVKKADGTDGPVLTINAGNGLAEHLIYNWNPSARNTSTDYNAAHEQQKVTGVTTVLSDAIQVSSTSGYTKSSTGTTATPTTPYFAAADKNTNHTYGPYNTTTGLFPDTKIYFYQNPNSKALTVITPSVTYPTATFWENIVSITKANVKKVGTGTGEVPRADAKSDKCVAYRLVTSDKTDTEGAIYTPTGQDPVDGDYVFHTGSDKEDLLTENAPTKTTGLFEADPNYFMIIPTNSDDEADKTIYVKITYYVSTLDPKLENGIVYTKNEVEKKIVLPHLKNGVAYNLKLILGLTSVKLEAEVADWETTNAEVNLPQNTAE